MYTTIEYVKKKGLEVSHLHSIRISEYVNKLYKKAYKISTSFQHFHAAGETLIISFYFQCSRPKVEIVLLNEENMIAANNLETMKIKTPNKCYTK